MTEAVAWQYLDRYVFNSENIDNIIAAEPTFHRMRDDRTDMEDLYRDWDPALIGHLEPGINLKKIKKIITG
jgi:acetone carboxylase gamma subunit